MLVVCSASASLSREILGRSVTLLDPPYLIPDRSALEQVIMPLMGRWDDSRMTLDVTMTRAAATLTDRRPSQRSDSQAAVLSHRRIQSVWSMQWSPTNARTGRRGGYE